VFTASQAGGGSKWRWVQPRVNGTGSVDYLQFGVVPPIEQGFDCLAGIPNKSASERTVKLATAIDEYLLLERFKGYN
jgi:hypothetical protein